MPVRWRVPVGPSWSSPAICQGRVYLGDCELTKPTAREIFRCLDSTTGATLWSDSWEVDYPDWAFSAQQDCGPTATPLVADGRVYALGSSGEVRCLDAFTGALIWHRELGHDYQIAQLQTRASPVLVGGLLILNVGAKPGACVIALDAATGVERWKALDEPLAASSPIVIDFGSRRQVIVWTGASITSLASETGDVLWRTPIVSSSNDTVATPVWSGDRLLISGMMLRLATDPPGATLLWPEPRDAKRRMLSNTSTPALIGQEVYGADTHGDLVCLDALTGTQLWKDESITDHRTGASIHLTRHGDEVLLYTNLGQLIRGRLSRSGFEKMDQVQLLDPVFTFGGRQLTWSPPAFAEGCVFVRNERELICARLVP